MQHGIDNLETMNIRHNLGIIILKLMFMRAITSLLTITVIEPRNISGRMNLAVKPFAGS
ncbi:MAG: hypothetical protein LBF42_01330 [Puniceicoccales bacterium]|nr:hypothetical protein [Puniceicoccales bacterium]